MTRLLNMADQDCPYTLQVMTHIPHPSNMTDQELQRTYYLRQVAEQLARIADALEHSSTSTIIPPAGNITDPDKLQTFTLRQVVIQLARTADFLQARAKRSSAS